MTIKIEVFSTRERTVLVVTHAEALANLADRVLHIKDGNLPAAPHV